ncbi:MAG: KOW motif-containing protein [Nanoarchaeota archaeon]
MHKTRSEVSKLWPVPRKGTKFLVVASHNEDIGIPVLVVMRDLLRLGKTKKEVKRIILLEKVKVNGKTIKDEKFPLVLFDVLSLGDKSLKLVIVNKRFSLEETKEMKKISKISGKNIVAGGKVQINLNDGRNFLTTEKVTVGDSVLFDFGKNKMEKIIELKSGSNVLVIGGSHIGEEGKIEKIDEKNKKAEVKFGKEKINLDLKRLMAV